MDKKIQNFKLNRASAWKDDEFYTQYRDIEKELVLYQDCFKGKKILCNCDHYQSSNFVKFFVENFAAFKLKSLAAISHDQSGAAEIFRMSRAVSGFIKTAEKTEHNGDFRNKESRRIWEEADIVVTNPPFSLFREFIDILIDLKLGFLIIGNSNAVTYHNCFNYIRLKKMWLGENIVRWFIRPDATLKEGSRSYWYTNLNNNREKRKIILNNMYAGNEKDYPEYDNFKAIEVNKTKNIPLDFRGVMGVPVTFLEKFNPDQFEILGMDCDVEKGGLRHLAKSGWQGKLDRGYLNSRRLYARVLIRHKKKP